jgi:predicted RNA-binding Zn-ribbon protein involved in translation (DUF1610 family)
MNDEQGRNKKQMKRKKKRIVVSTRPCPKTGCDGIMEATGESTRFMAVFKCQKCGFKKILAGDM